MARSVVALVRTKPETVLDDVGRAMRLAGYRSALDAAAATILKDNVSWHLPFLSANTTPWQLEGVIRELRAGGYQDLVAVHNDTVVTDPFKGGRLNKLTPVYAAYGVPERYNFEPRHMRWVRYEPRAHMRVLDRIYPEGIYLPDFFFGKNVVHLPTVKCHIYTTTTGAMKNAFGGLLNTKRHYTHSWIHDTLVDLLAIQQEIHAGLFAVTDGTIVGNGPGPRTMTPVQKDVILASADQVAVDAVAARLMGFDPLSIPYIRTAHESGLGCANLGEIEVVGEPDIADENWGFRVGHNLASRVGHWAWFGSHANLQNLLFRTPLVHLFVLASAIYHDRIWWPLKGSKIQRRVRAETSWGRAFDAYEPAADAASFRAKTTAGQAGLVDLPRPVRHRGSFSAD